MEDGSSGTATEGRNWSTGGVGEIPGGILSDRTLARFLRSGPEQDVKRLRATCLRLKLISSLWQFLVVLVLFARLLVSPSVVVLLCCAPFLFADVFSVLGERMWARVFQFDRE